MICRWGWRIQSLFIFQYIWIGRINQFVKCLTDFRRFLSTRKVCLLYNVAVEARDTLIAYFAAFNMGLNPKKIEGPTCILEILGVEYNSIKMTKKILNRKIVSFNNLCLELFASDYCTVHICSKIIIYLSMRKRAT